MEHKNILHSRFVVAGQLYFYSLGKLCLEAGSKRVLFNNVLRRSLNVNHDAACIMEKNVRGGGELTI